MWLIQRDLFLKLEEKLKVGISPHRNIIEPLIKIINYELEKSLQR